MSVRRRRIKERFERDSRLAKGRNEFLDGLKQLHEVLSNLSDSDRERVSEVIRRKCADTPGAAQ